MSVQLARSSTISSGNLPQNESLSDLESEQILAKQFRNELSKQRIVSYLTTAMSESSQSFKLHEQFKEATISFIESGRSPVVRLPDSPSKDKFVSLQKWEGFVIEVKKDAFFARLRDLTKENPEEEAEFLLEEVSDEDKKLLKPGAVFYWNIGYLDSKTGQRKRISIIRFRRLPAWSKEEIEAAKREAQALIESLANPTKIAELKRREEKSAQSKQPLPPAPCPAAIAEAIEDSEIVVSDKNTFETMIKGNKEIALRIIKKLAQRLQEADNQIENLLIKDDTSMIANLLAKIVKDEGIDTTTDDMARMFGMASKEVDKVKEKIAKRKIIDIRGGRIIVTNKEKLNHFMKDLMMKRIKKVFKDIGES